MRKSFAGWLAPVALAAAALVSAPAHAAIDSYTATLLGANEVGGGDPDGFGLALLAIDNVANTVSWSILALGIDLPLTGAHIHAAPAGVNGGVIVNFSAQLSGSGLADPDLALITPGSAANYYVNLHNAAYGSGAIRGQLQYLGTVSPPIPEPETYALMLAGLGVVGFAARRRHQRG
jgi:CHRD domain/PEP-CTERM motif